MLSAQKQCEEGRDYIKLTSVSKPSIAVTSIDAANVPNIQDGKLWTISTSDGVIQFTITSSEIIPDFKSLAVTFTGYINTIELKIVSGTGDIHSTVIFICFFLVG